MNKYFMSILEDKPIEEFSALVAKQIKMKKEAKAKHNVIIQNQWV